MTDSGRIRLTVLLWISCISFLNLLDVSGQDENPRVYGGNDFFFSDSVVDLILITDLDSLLADVGDDPSYHEGIIVCSGPDGSQVQINIEARVRGNFRRNAEHCDFPPLKIKFSKEDTPGTLFEGFRDLKIVSTHPRL